ncbi:MAG: PDC sensor domain-containing protein [Thiofilum sp.]|uniref:PDC sensor domain-containing protein n=1 Tax=Thiofilum sp. TaxID=2212733 RepID=UPI0025F12D96|nr:PDC sensor domain-containing protein [Thiofilum sp.]MBK8455267.1 PDC sensor domain-containing protein [Thiofilum sp.]
MPHTLQRSIEHQRARLIDLLHEKLKNYTVQLIPNLHQRDILDQQLREIFQSIDYCKYVYVLDANAVQLSSTLNRFGADTSAYQRDRSTRPYMQHRSDESCDFNLSEVYISQNKKRPSLTAIQTIRGENGERLGFLGVDYDLRELPHSDVIYEEPSQWRQIKGDPAIRQGLFAQERVESLMDQKIDHVLSVIEALVVDQGVYHFQIHFSSSRVTLWHVDNPYVYRILTMAELADSNICLAYPRRAYFERAIVPHLDIKKVLKQFKALRFADETIYLRVASLNIVNGQVDLNFSCDGTHYIDNREFLAKGLEFWLGNQSNQSSNTCVDIDYAALDKVVDELAKYGCMKVNQLLGQLERDEVPEVLKAYSAPERDYIYQELKSVMEVYEGGVCGI